MRDSVEKSLHASSTGSDPASNHAHGQPFDRERLTTKIDLDRRVIGIGGFEEYEIFAPTVLLHRRFIIDARDDDLPVPDFGRSMHGQQIAIENIRVFHTVAAHA